MAKTVAYDLRLSRMQSSQSLRLVYLILYDLSIVFFFSATRLSIQTHAKADVHCVMAKTVADDMRLSRMQSSHAESPCLCDWSVFVTGLFVSLRLVYRCVCLCDWSICSDARKGWRTLGHGEDSHVHCVIAKTVADDLRLSRMQSSHAESPARSRATCERERESVCVYVCVYVCVRERESACV